MREDKMTKICSKCKETKSTKEYHRDIYNKNGLDNQCKKCRNAYRRKYRKLRKQISSKRSGESCKRRLENRYNVSIKQHQILFDAQNGCCAICGKHQSEFKQSLGIDHNHKTGIIRGLLCTYCNVALGIYENQQSQLEKYLQTVSQRMIKIYKEWME